MADEQAPKPRSIDERLDALTMNGELFLRDLEATRERIDKLAESIEKLTSAAEALLEIVQSHERRITGLERS